MYLIIGIGEELTGSQDKFSDREVANIFQRNTNTPENVAIDVVESSPGEC